MGVYLRPQALEDALDALSETPLAILAGGTDFYPARVGRPLDDDVLDITAIDALRGIERHGDGWCIGALATWTDLIRAALPSAFDGLKAAAREVGGVQIQNTGTIAGNLCNASPAADGVPSLLALDAAIELSSVGGTRTVRLADFIIGNRSTVRTADELVTGIVVPESGAGAQSTFVKLGARKYLVISIVMAGFVIEPDGDAVGRARIAVGACSPVARRLDALEAALVGRPLDAALGDLVTADHLKAVLAPIDDVRGTAEYRAGAALTVVRRGLSELGGQMAGAQRTGGR
ncbi:MAG TPA: FAD binding domain-containing protein [Alphaproteobacteria bacterium]|nr:FAD binding domain-containing protein [Alphaproteobacteria bacterium]